MKKTSDFDAGLKKMTKKIEDLRKKRPFTHEAPGALAAGKRPAQIKKQAGGRPVCFFLLEKRILKIKRLFQILQCPARKQALCCQQRRLAPALLFSPGNPAHAQPAQTQLQKAP
ncbi:hypothetical protein [Acinetobacter sp.]|uniref:hypothetical protein n=1 Tax=Acinetobacter sp. TaxID=472 RepID=UPI0035AE7DA7